jgi:hypothetical protein
VPSTLTGVAASATQSTSPTASAPADGDSLAASGVQGPLQTILNHIAKIWAGAFAAIGTNPALQATGSATRAPLNLVPQAAPSAPGDGDVWVETTSNQVKARVAGATQTLTPTSGTAPVAITPTANWTALYGLAYWKDGGGIVHVKGAVQFSATANLNSVFTLPAGFRPAATTFRGWAAGDPTQTGRAAYAQIDSSGVLTLSVSTAMGPGEIVMLDCMSFLAEQ